MLDLSFKDLPTEQAMAMGDGLAAQGHVQTARNLYQAALDRENRVWMRYRLRVRIGIISVPNARTPGLLRMLQELEAQDSRFPVFVGAGMATWLKTVPFLDDERFLALEQKHSHLLPIANWHWNLHVVLWALQQTKEVEGDHLELGVFKGHTSLFASEYVEFQTWPKRWWLVDTFEGIPDDQVDKGWEQVNENLYKGAYHYEDVVQRFAAFPNIEVVKGRVPEILHERCPEKISFLHIDLNNTAAEIAALELLLDRLSPGAVLILDDYCWASARAQFEAERVWFRERGLHVLGLPTGQGVFIKR